ncbi:putative inactive G-type lectin S-receptor-like serine/threonine-protein kinase SRK [Bidens hawaiensis]|uniref:putative inactive G-type lectin S-receptor-like serine/threonine-protein kinase SRK n=1 Tax=Bidens hawaiensis TaxID=980011 RepID=UPI00404A112D
MAERRVINTKFIFGFFVVLYVSISFTFGADTIFANQIIRYNDTIVSPQETFELGFFSPGNSMTYIGIWYKKRSYRTIVWVANRDAPLAHTSGELTLTLQGVLSLRDITTGTVLWNSSGTSLRNPIGRLLDTGNFIIYEEGDDFNQENPIWQSFDFITDTLLEGMKYGKNMVTGVEKRFRSWKSEDDPATGNFSYWVDTRGYPQLVLTEGPDIIKFRGGSWNGLRFTRFPNLRPNSIYNYTFVISQQEVYFSFKLINNLTLMRVVLHPDGRLQRLLWDDGKQDWTVFLAPESDQCDHYAVCGPNGRCNIDNSPICECLKGFEPKYPDRWSAADSSQGCQRTVELDCGPGEGFNIYSNLKLPDTRWSRYYQTMSLAECEKMCKSNCSCSAYTNSNISGTGSGCLLWFGDLIDIRKFSENGDTLYIRMPLSELDSIETRKSSSARIRLRVIVSVLFVVLVILVSICLFYRFNKKKQHQQGTSNNEFENDHENRSGEEDLELPLFGLSTLLKATNNFSVNNKLGEGGFGPVYKGISDALLGELNIPEALTEKEKNDILEKAHSAIILSLGDRVLREVSKELTAGGVWDKLESLYMTNSNCKSCILKETVAYVSNGNWSPYSAIDMKVPMEMWSGMKTSYDNLKVFGCVVYSHISQGKLDPRSQKCIMLGYPDGVKGYKLWRLYEGSPKATVSRNVVFKEYIMYKDVKDKWLAAMQDSMMSLHKNQTWVWVEKPEDQKVVDCKWIFKVKDGISGEVPTFKARAILSITEVFNLELEKLDVKTAFLHGNLDEKIYMRQPLEFEEKGQGDKDQDQIDDSKKFLMSAFEMKELGEAKKILGMEIHRDRVAGTIKLSRESYLKKVLSNNHMDDCKSLITPLAIHYRLSELDCRKNDEEKDKMVKVPYTNVVGSLMYIMVCTRPGIGYAFSIVSGYLSNPG